jgi:hypothetical protein
MPYGIFDTGNSSKPYCVHKKDEEGEPVGKPLGCHETREQAEEQIAAIHSNEGKVVHRSLGSVKPTKLVRQLEVLGVPYGGPHHGKDADGEYFSPATRLYLKPGDKRPVFYNHGSNPDNRLQLYPTLIGEATYLGPRNDGHWFSVEVEDVIEEGKRIVEAAASGIARASSGAVNYLTRIKKATGEILVWPLAELTLIDREMGKREPANEYAVAHLKTVYEQSGLELPEAVVQGGEPETTAVDGESGCSKTYQAKPYSYYETLKEVRRHGR